MESFVYILTNKSHKSLYVGMTADLLKRLYQHETHFYKGSYSDKYNTTICIYYEVFNDINLAIKREKEIKGWLRSKKEALINSKNPEWKTLATSRGFVRTEKYVPFEQEVKQFLEEYYREEGK